MKTSLGIAVILFMLLFSGCMNSTPQQGQPGAPGQAGQTGQQGQAAPCPAGQHRNTNPETGAVRCVPD